MVAVSSYLDIKSAHILTCVSMSLFWYLLAPPFCMIFCTHRQDRQKTTDLQRNLKKLSPGYRYTPALRSRTLSWHLLPPPRPLRHGPGPELHPAHHRRQRRGVGRNQGQDRTWTTFIGMLIISGCFHVQISDSVVQRLRDEMNKPQVRMLFSL